MRTLRTKVYKFSELNKTAKQTAIDNNRDINTNYDWYEHIVEEFKEDNKFFEVTEIYFRGFSSQGDGAMFEYTGINKEFINTIIDSLKLSNWKKNVLKKYSYVSGNGKQRGHYYHEKSVSHEIYTESDNGAQYYANIEEFIDKQSVTIEAQIIKKYEELAKDLYKKLDSSNDYLTSDKVIAETLISNEFEFTADGKMI